MKLKAILFDLDDTIIDRRISLMKYAEYFADHFNTSLEPISMEELCSVILDKDRKGYQKRDDFFADLTSALPWIKPPHVDTLSRHWYAHYPSSSVVTSGLFDGLNELSSMDIILGIVTNGTNYAQNAKIDYIGIRKFMQTVVVSEAAGVKKPDQRIFQMALQEIGIAETDAWFVGDHPINDIVGAAAACLTPVWLRGKHDWPEQHKAPTLQIDSLSELLSLAKRYGG
jgi:putative hydrolase of the HAD superfamily